ncbi:hypothetical protein KY290_036024 [Solanum tuberosum]|uniref:ubiquitinyl hydrolase 1 n=1 Tax=Solanum tuberosum TaxID=4113 RepID=A0ABQ7TRK0_SOLTU|nr:hypothetical protein KY289_037806 [Solanum tuberosum]KAH0737319.1 hypothetical protein KY290_036024 [Solanum tuberosum]
MSKKIEDYQNVPDKLKDQLLVSPPSATNAKCSQYPCKKEFDKIDDLKNHYKGCHKEISVKNERDAETAGQFEMEELIPRRPREYNDDVTFFFKPYDRGKKDNLRYAGRLFAKGIRKLYASDQEIELYEVVHFQSLDKPKEEGLCSELSRIKTYNEVVGRVARQLEFDDPSRIRLTSHNCYLQQPIPEAIPLPELQGLKTLKVAFHQTTKDEHRDVCGAWEQYLGLEDSDGAPKRTHAAHQVFNAMFGSKVGKISEEEKHLGTHHRLVHVYHFNWEAAQNQMQIHNFGEPFVLIIPENGTLAVLKLRIQKKLQVPYEEFAKWTFAFLLLGHPKYLEDLDILSSHFQGVSVAWEQYLGLDHSDGAPKRTPAAHQVELSQPDAELRLLEVFYYRTYKKKQQLTPRTGSGITTINTESVATHQDNSSDIKVPENVEGWQTVTKRKGKNKDVPTKSEIVICPGSNTKENMNASRGSTSQAHSTKQEKNQINTTHKIGTSEDNMDITISKIPSRQHQPTQQPNPHNLRSYTRKDKMKPPKKSPHLKNVQKNMRKVTHKKESVFADAQDQNQVLNSKLVHNYSANFCPPLFGLNHKLLSGKTGRKNENKDHLTLNSVLNPLQPIGLVTESLSNKDIWEDTSYKDCVEDLSLDIMIEDPGHSLSDDELIRGQKSILPKIKTVGKDSQVQQNVAYYNNLSPSGSLKAIERLISLKDQYKFPYMFIQEPMVNSKKIDKFRRRLGYQHCFHNTSNKIWIFWTNGYQLDIIEDEVQHVLVHIKFPEDPNDFHLSIVYAKCDELLRVELWDNLRDIAARINGPWGVVGDFNVIIDAEEKIGVDHTD